MTDIILLLPTIAISSWQTMKHAVKLSGRWYKTDNMHKVQPVQIST